MYYQFTGQPGHGKTVLAIEMALKLKANADKLHEQDPEKHPYRELYVCNIRSFKHAEVGSLPMTPEELMGWCDHPDYLVRLTEFQSSPEYRQLKTDKDRHDAREEWILSDPDLQRLANACINPIYENAIIVIDEAYEFGMFPRRPTGRPVPRHIERIAKHRHFGIDFIMISQSPKKQMDDFLHDLIEEHYHVRRRWGMPLAMVKRFDCYEAHPDKAQPLTRSRRRYPKHIFNLYQSTKYDTSEKRVPWYYPAMIVLTVAVLGGAVWSYNSVMSNFGDKDPPPVVQSSQPATTDGAVATAGGAGGIFASDRPKRVWSNAAQYADDHLPRIGAMPWTAPIYDHRAATSDPQLICMSSPGGNDAQGIYKEPSCTCLTEQGTAYDLSQPECRTLARRGPVYNPYKTTQPASSGPVSSPATAPDSMEPQEAPIATTVAYSPGARPDQFPRSPGYKGGSYTGPTSTL